MINNNLLATQSIYDDYDYYIYAHLDLQLISKIIFGINSEKEDEIKIIKMVANNGLNPGFQKMILNPDSLMIESVPYTKR